MLRDWGEAPKTAEPNADIELQEELRAEDSSDEDSSYVPHVNTDDETVSSSEDDSEEYSGSEEDARATQATGPTAAERSATPGRTAERSAREWGEDGKCEGECTAECACGHASFYTILFWLAGTIMTFVAGFEFTYTFEAAFNIHHLLSDKAFSTSAIICFVCLLLSVILCFSLPCVQGGHKKCGFSSTSKCFSPFLSLIAILYCVSFGLAVHARNGLDDTVEDYCDLWDDEEEETGGGWYYYSFDCDKDVKEHLLHYLNVLLCCTAINAALTAAVACICWLDPGGILSDKPVPSDGPSDAVVDVESVESGAGTRTSIEGEETVLDGEVVTSPASSENVVDAEPVSPSISFWAAGLVAAAGERARRALSPREPEAQEGAESPVPPPPPVNVKAKKTLTKKEIKKMTKEIKAKIKSGAELDEDEEAFAEEHELWK